MPDGYSLASPEESVGNWGASKRRRDDTGQQSRRSLFPQPDVLRNRFVAARLKNANALGQSRFGKRGRMERLGRCPNLKGSRADGSILGRNLIDAVDLQDVHYSPLRLKPQSQLIAHGRKDVGLRFGWIAVG